MELKRLVVAAFLVSAAAVGCGAYAVPAGDASAAQHVENGRGAESGTRVPVWPASTVAEREIQSPGQEASAQLVVEERQGHWTAWILMTPESGEARAMNFFTGQVIRPVKFLKVDGKTSFIDPEGAQHTQVPDLDLSVSRGEAEDYVGKIQINTDFAIFDCDGCARDVDFSERIESVSPRASVWKKAPIYPDGDGWSSRIGSAVDMGDGTLLFIGGRFAFRVDQRDFAPVGSAPNLHVVDERWVEGLIETAASAHVDITDAYLTDQLRLMRHDKKDLSPTLCAFGGIRNC